MPLVRKTHAELEDFRLAAAQRARLDALTDEEITPAAKADPHNPPITAAEFKRMRRAKGRSAAKDRHHGR